MDLQGAEDKPYVYLDKSHCFGYLGGLSIETDGPYTFHLGIQAIVLGTLAHVPSILA